MAKLIGNAPNQVPTNADLGSMAFEDKVSVANLNATGTKDATTFLRGDNTFASAGGVNTPAFSAYRNTTTAQVISDNVYTVGELTGKFFDTDSAFDTSTYRFTVPSGKGGIYVFHFGTVFTTTFSAGTTYNVGIKRNGSIYYGSLQSVSTGASGQVILKGSWTQSLNAGDYIELITRQNSGANANFTGGSITGHLLPYLSGFRLIK